MCEIFSTATVAFDHAFSYLFDVQFGAGSFQEINIGIGLAPRKNLWSRLESVKIERSNPKIDMTRETS